jgi:hypothetical protein
MLTRESFFAVPLEMPFEVVETEHGACRVYVMTLGEKDVLDIAHNKADGRHFRPRLMVATMRDENGNPLFTEADFSRLEAMPVTVTEPFIKAIVRINRMTDDYAEATRKNSPSQEANSSIA